MAERTQEENLRTLRLPRSVLEKQRSRVDMHKGILTNRSARKDMRRIWQTGSFCRQSRRCPRMLDRPRDHAKNAMAADTRRKTESCSHCAGEELVVRAEGQAPRRVIKEGDHGRSPENGEGWRGIGELWKNISQASVCRAQKTDILQDAVRGIRRCHTLHAGIPHAMRGTWPRGMSRNDRRGLRWNGARKNVKDRSLEFKRGVVRHAGRIRKRLRRQGKVCGYRTRRHRDIGRDSENRYAERRWYFVQFVRRFEYSSRALQEADTISVDSHLVLTLKHHRKELRTDGFATAATVPRQSLYNIVTPYLCLHMGSQPVNVPVELECLPVSDHTNDEALAHKSIFSHLDIDIFAYRPPNPRDQSFPSSVISSMPPVSLIHIISFTLAGGDVFQTIPATYAFYKKQWVKRKLSPACFFYAVARYMSIISLVTNGIVLAGMAVQILVFLRFHKGAEERTPYRAGPNLFGMDWVQFSLAFRWHICSLTDRVSQPLMQNGGCKGRVLHANEGLLYFPVVFLVNLWVVMEFLGVLQTGAASTLPRAIVLIVPPPAIQHLILSTQNLPPNKDTDFSSSQSSSQNKNQRRSALVFGAVESGQAIEFQSNVSVQSLMDDPKTSRRIYMKFD
ncbi:hypothetical protein DFH08DRAFT_940201 [Mycena albidolilacea]|uniref:Uncharacterized protein n=1 Tax=Mycena albidolilacea TaxID=1033008 RepID=A0AAD6ZNM2_9AGAR|nr:hypothetical protein DFH08DRAFT_940201 [Mycena albidolilacea]